MADAAYFDGEASGAQWQDTPHGEYTVIVDEVHHWDHTGALDPWGVLQDLAEETELMRRRNARLYLALCRAEGRPTRIITGHDGVTRVVVR